MVPTVIAGAQPVRNSFSDQYPSSDPFSAQFREHVRRFSADGFEIVEIGQEPAGAFIDWRLPEWGADAEPFRSAFSRLPVVIEPLTAAELLEIGAERRL